MTHDEQKLQGGFSGVTHEMTDLLMTLSLNPSEWRLIMFFIRYLQGFQMKERLIKTAFIIEKTGMTKQKCLPALNDLVDRKVIERRPGWQKGEYIYRWNEALFERTHATSEVFIDPKVTDLMTYKKEKEVTESMTKKSPNRLLKSHRFDDHLVTGSVTPKRRKTALVAAARAPKDKRKKYILKSEKLNDSERTLPPEDIIAKYPQFFRSMPR